MDTNGTPTAVGDVANNAARVNCVAGCGGGGGTQDVNVIQLLGVAPGAVNPFPQRLSTGAAFYDARDRNWTLSSGTDSIAAVQSGVWNIGTLTSITNPVAVTGTFFQATQPVSGPLTDAQLRAVPVPVSGTAAATQSGVWTVQPGNTPNTSPWLTESIKVGSANNDGACPSGAGNTTALASNASRRAAYLVASSANTDDIFLKLGATATSADFRLAPGQPFNIMANSIYTGIIDFIPASGTQALCVAELN